MTIERVPMLPGRSTAAYLRILAGPFLLCTLDMAWGGLTRLFPAMLKSDAVFAITVVIMTASTGAILVSLVVGVLYLRRRAAEARAGYTLVNGYRRDLPQLDPETGAIVRAAGSRTR